MRSDSAQPSLLPEQRVAIEGIRRAFGLNGLREDASDGYSTLDWNAMLNVAFREGVHPVVFAGLSSADYPMPGPVRARFRMGSLGAAMWADALLAPALRRILQALGDRGIQPVVLKGAALAYTAYPEPHQRTMSDVDLLLYDEEMDAAGEIVHGLGFLGNYWRSAPEHHSPMHFDPDSRLGVELHRHLLPRPNPFAAFEEECRTRCRVAAIAGVEAKVLAPEDSLLFACLHLAYSHRYRFHPLRSLTDILAMAASWSEQLDWDLLVGTAALTRAAGAVYWPLRFSHDWLGAPIPDSVLCRLAPSGTMRRLIAAVMEPRYVLDGEVLAGQGNEVLFNTALSLSLYHGCSGLEQARAVLGGFFPSPEHVGHLPPEVTGSRLRYLAQLYRPDRLARGAVAVARLLARASRNGRPGTQPRRDEGHEESRSPEGPEMESPAPGVQHAEPVTHQSSLIP